MKFLLKFCPLCKHSLHWAQADGRKRLVCRKCGWINYENPLPVAACAAINRENKVLITRRNLEPGMNKWALPGGFIELGESPEKACLRELQEETGVIGKIIRLIGVYAQKTRKYGSLLVVGYAVKALKEDISVSSEVKEAKFVSRQGLPHIPFSTHRGIIEEAYKSGS